LVSLIPIFWCRGDTRRGAGIVRPWRHETLMRAMAEAERDGRDGWKEPHPISANQTKSNQIKPARSSRFEVRSSKLHDDERNQAYGWPKRPAEGSPIKANQTKSNLLGIRITITIRNGPSSGPSSCRSRSVRLSQTTEAGLTMTRADPQP
jgi:hypothetical protein